MLESTDPDNHWPKHLLEQMARDVEYVNRLNGWYDDERTFFDELWLLASEIFEAGEAWRVAGFEDQTTAEQVLYGRGDHGEDLLVTSDNPKPEGVGSELADVLIRLLDTAKRHGIDLMAEYQRKMLYNLTRGYRHGGKRL